MSDTEKEPASEETLTAVCASLALSAAKKIRLQINNPSADHATKDTLVSGKRKDKSEAEIGPDAQKIAMFPIARAAERTMSRGKGSDLAGAIIVL